MHILLDEPLDSLFPNSGFVSQWPDSVGLSKTICKKAGLGKSEPERLDKAGTIFQGQSLRFGKGHIAWAKSLTHPSTLIGRNPTWTNPTTQTHLQCFEDSSAFLWKHDENGPKVISPCLQIKTPWHAISNEENLAQQVKDLEQTFSQNQKWKSLGDQGLSTPRNDVTRVLTAFAHLLAMPNGLAQCQTLWNQSSQHRFSFFQPGYGLAQHHVMGTTGFEKLFTETSCPRKAAQTATKLLLAVLKRHLDDQTRNALWWSHTTVKVLKDKTVVEHKPLWEFEHNQSPLDWLCQNKTETAVQEIRTRFGKTEMTKPFSLAIWIDKETLDCAHNTHAKMIALKHTKWLKDKLTPQEQKDFNDLANTMF